MELLDTVVLKTNLPEHGLRAGEVGAIVEVDASDRFEVEFVATDGHTRALLTLTADALSPAPTARR